MRLILTLSVVVLTCSATFGQMGTGLREVTDWPMPWSGQAPGAMAVELPRPAGRGGNIVVRDGHFYSGDQRIRFWGVNIAFGGNFPTHEQADAVAQRLSRFGFNAVRLHHMDNQPFPNGIWADRSCDHLSPEALDRLDYFISALKKQGIWANINLHVSRDFARNHNWPNAGDLDSYDKMVDLFHPDLIAAQKQYAKDLLTHVNRYTNTRLADEPAVAIVEINNEDGLFMWGSDTKLQNLPEPYASLLNKLWNRWLAEQYGTREKLKVAWSRGEETLGQNLLGDAWAIEQHDSARMQMERSRTGAKSGMVLHVTAVDDTSWHLQVSHPRLKIRKGQFYTLRFTAQSSVKDLEVSLAVAQAHEPWNNLGLASTFVLSQTPRTYTSSFVASSDDENGRVSFSVGRKVASIVLSDVLLAEGGRVGLSDAEDPARGTVLSHGKAAPESPARLADWYGFLQQTDQKFWGEMYRYLKQDLGVQCAVTGTIGFGPLGTLSQSQMDFVDQHSYWEHPHFPRRPWDARDWVINNRPMSDNPAEATLWALAATRVEGKPFTVTEYQHSAPNEWQAECMPMIAAYAALQDWDGVFIFAYRHNSPYDRPGMSGYFDIEGNVLKMAPAPLAARIFLDGGVKPLAGQIVVHARLENILRNTPKFWYENWGYVQQEHGLTWQSALDHRLALSFTPQSDGGPRPALGDSRISWSSSGPATGKFILNDPHAVVFTGFPGKGPIEIGPLRIDGIDAPFVTVMAVPADGRQTLAGADRILLSVVARAENTGMKWNAQRTSVGDQWGKGPMRLEVVRGEVSFESAVPVAVRALDGQGEVKESLPVKAEGGAFVFKLAPTAWYEVTRKEIER